MHTRILVTVAALALASTAQAAIIYNANVTPGVIFGNGNQNGSFTVDSAGGIELGLRGKLRHAPPSGAAANIFNSNGDGTYSFVAGVGPGQSGNTAVWSVEFSINTNASGTTGLQLNDFTYAFGRDSDPTQGTSFIVSDIINGTGGINPLLGVLAWDHAMGDNNSVQCNSNNSNAGCYGNRNQSDSAADYQSRIAQLNVAQNSWKPSFADVFGANFDPTVDGTYNFYLAAFRGGQQVARSDIQIIVGQGGAAVPVSSPGTLALAGLGLLGMVAGAGRRKS